VSQQLAHALAASALPFTVLQQQAVSLSADSLASSGFAFDFGAPQNNLPGTYNNTMFLWSSTDDPPIMVPWFSAPVASQTLSDNETSDQVSPSAGNTFPAGAYVLGFSVGPSVTSGTSTTYPNVCATALIPGSWDPAKVQYQFPKLGVVSTSRNGVTFSYVLPNGYIPMNNNTWIGIWRNMVPLYNQSQAPFAFGQVNQPDSSSAQRVAVNPGLSPNTIYTAGLFTSGWSKTAANLVTTALAATVTFQTGTG